MFIQLLNCSKAEDDSKVCYQCSKQKDSTTVYQAVTELICIDDSNGITMTESGFADYKSLIESKGGRCTRDNSATGY